MVAISFKVATDHIQLWFIVMHPHLVTVTVFFIFWAFRIETKVHVSYIKKLEFLVEQHSYHK